MPLHYVRRLTVVSLLVCTVYQHYKGSDMLYYNKRDLGRLASLFTLTY